MKNYFELDFYHNYGGNSRLVNQLKHELNSLGCKTLTHQLTDYDIINNWLETRFTLSHQLHLNLFLDTFKIDHRLLNTPIEYNEKTIGRFESNDIFRVPRYGIYVTKKINEMLLNYNIQITYCREYEMLYYFFLETQKLTLESSKYSWDYIKKFRKISTHFEYFLGMFSGSLKEDPNQLFFKENMEVVNSITSHMLSKAS
jgi:hypothetical protein